MATGSAGENEGKVGEEHGGLHRTFQPVSTSSRSDMTYDIAYISRTYDAYIVQNKMSPTARLMTISTTVNVTGAILPVTTMFAEAHIRKAARDDDISEMFLLRPARLGCRQVFLARNLMSAPFADVTLLVGMLSLVLHVLTCNGSRRPVVCVMAKYGMRKASLDKAHAS